MMNDSSPVLSFREEMRLPFDGILPEISVYFSDQDKMRFAIELLVANAYLPASTMQREGSAKREVVANKHSPKEIVHLVQSGRHLLLKKAFGLPDLGVGILEDSMRLDFRPGPEWSDEQITRLVETLRLLRNKVNVSDIYLDEMEEHFSRDGMSGFQELLEG